MAVAQHLPQGRSQAGDRHLNFHETRDNLGRVRALVLAVLAVAGLVVGVSTPAEAAAPGHARQVTADGFADPGFNHFGARYYLCATGDHFPVRSATSPTGPYSSSGNSMPAIPNWVGLSPKGRHDLWAPSVFRTTDRSGQLFIMYFSGFRKGWGANCVGVATSRSPDHGFRAVGAPICATRNDHEGAMIRTCGWPSAG